MKKSDIYLKEYCQRLSEDNLKFLVQRLSQQLSGDLPEVFDFFSSVREIDRWLASAESCNEIFEMTDQICLAIQKECERRATPVK